jgi:phage FluMu protein Com
MSETHVDGNAVAGALGEVFAADMTVVRGTCAHCGRVSVLAETNVYALAPGIVVRCAGCGGVLLRLVRASRRAWLDARGLTCLQLEMPDG